LLRKLIFYGDKSRLDLLCNLYISLVWVYKVWWTNKKNI